MKTKELKKYPFRIILMAVTFVINMLLPLLFSYLIDDILISKNFGMLLQWFMVTLVIAMLSMIMKFFLSIIILLRSGYRIALSFKNGH